MKEHVHQAFKHENYFVGEERIVGGKLSQVQVEQKLYGMMTNQCGRTAEHAVRVRVRVRG